MSERRPTRRHLTYPTCRRRWGKPVLLPAILTAAAALSGCGPSLHFAPPSTSASSSTSTSTSEPTTTSFKAPAVATSSRLPAGTVLRAPGTVYSDCDPISDGNGGYSFNTDAEIFNPKTGMTVALPTPTLPSGQQLLGGACTVGGDTDSIRAYYIVTRSTPSSGLTPESVVTEIVSLDPFTPGPALTKPLPPEIDPEDLGQLRPTKYGFLIEHQHPEQSLASEFIGINGTTLDKAFTIDGSGPVPQTSANQSAILINFYGGEVRIHSAQDGRLLGHYQESGGMGSYPNGFLFDVDETRHGVKSAMFDTDDNQVKVPFAAPGGDMWGNTYLAFEDHAMEVRDTETNTVTLRREGADYDGLHIESASVAGNYLYLQNDSDNPVIDITTTQKVSSGWTVRPTDVVNRDWLLILDGGPEAEDAGSCFDGYELKCNAEALTLQHAPGGKYSGAWY